MIESKENKLNSSKLVNSPVRPSDSGFTRAINLPRKANNFLNNARSLNPGNLDREWKRETIRFNLHPVTIPSFDKEKSFRTASPKTLNASEEEYRNRSGKGTQFNKNIAVPNDVTKKPAQAVNECRRESRARNVTPTINSDYEEIYEKPKRCFNSSKKAERVSRRDQASQAINDIPEEYEEEYEVTIENIKTREATVYNIRSKSCSSVRQPLAKKNHGFFKFFEHFTKKVTCQDK